MKKTSKALTWAVVTQFSGRKKAGYISVFVNMETMEIYPVPLDIEHIDYAASLLGIERDDIRADPSIAEHLIPSIIMIKEDIVVGVATGASGMEIAFRVRHKRENLEAAHQIVWQFIRKGEIHIAEDLEEDRVIYRYASD